MDRAIIACCLLLALATPAQAISPAFAAFMAGEGPIFTTFEGGTIPAPWTANSWTTSSSEAYAGTYCAYHAMGAAGTGSKLTMTRYLRAGTVSAYLKTSDTETGTWITLSVVGVDSVSYQGTTYQQESITISTPGTYTVEIYAQSGNANVHHYRADNIYLP